MHFATRMLSSNYIRLMRQGFHEILGPEKRTTCVRISHETSKGTASCI